MADHGRRTGGRQSRRRPGSGRRSASDSSAGGPVDALSAVLAADGPADLALKQFFRKHHQWGARDRRRIGDQCFRVLRHLRSLRAGLDAAGQRPDDASALLTLAQAKYDDGVATEGQPPWLAQARQAITNSPSAGVQLELPDWLVDGLAAAADQAHLPALAASLLAQGSLDLRVNLSRRSRQQVLATLAEDEVHTVVPTDGICPPGLLRVVDGASIERSRAFQRGEVEVQDAGSQLLARLSGARRQETVVDLCAGAGGKTLAMADMTRDTGNLYACDRSARRLARLAPRLERAGLRSVRPLAIDSEHDPKLARLTGRADLVFIDAPCSGTGTLRRSPWVKWQLTPDNVLAYTQVQQSLLAAGARLLRPGGRLIYATCSLLTDENEAVAGAFEASHPNFERQDLFSRAGLANEPARPAVPDGQAGYCRIWPHIDGCDGYFVAGWTAPLA